MYHHEKGAYQIESFMLLSFLSEGWDMYWFHDIGVDGVLRIYCLCLTYGMVFLMISPMYVIMRL